ncbi:MaoC family dehydratase [Halopseudomonas phragmitis]|uniref:Dehydratase n=1 Tax=Halopseudomonas phragmitis TaxID=1931241 RepID=A0A1V0B944_9GAMM|nr:MaoC family dehydratase [Halopseudomonas phragmitis]AQZ96458.1 dehydratase [Halopseudomonas phragmitis]
MMTIFDSAAALEQALGQSLGVTDWLLIEQSRVDQFAEATGDHQWIHVDPEKARSGPFGGTIAHGYLTLSLVNYFLPRLMRVENLQMGVNYGCDRVRFPAPVRVGARIRGAGEITQVETLANGAVQVVVRVTVEVDGSDRPGCVVDTISRYTFNSDA